MAFAAETKYPMPLIRILIPFPAGGVADTIGRTLGEQLTVQMDQPTVGESLPGFAASNWNGVFVPAKTSIVVVEKLFVELTKTYARTLVSLCNIRAAL